MKNLVAHSEEPDESIIKASGDSYVNQCMKCESWDLKKSFKHV